MTTTKPQAQTFPVAPEDYKYATKQRGRVWPRSEGFEVRGVPTGQRRPAKPGEWYLSGAIPECYLAANGSTLPCDIVRLEVCRRVWEIVEVQPTKEA